MSAGVATNDASAVSWGATAQPAAADILRSAIQRDELGHAFLLLGPVGVGQRELARALTAALNCEDAADGAACGTCATCRRIGRDTHTCLVSFEPEGANHLVSAVREEWLPLASRTLAEGHRRVIRIVAADRMNETAQNAFLKALEEPPASTIWLLEAPDDSALLDTILSRCSRLDLTGWSPQALQGRAEELEVPVDQVEASVRAAMGSPDRLAEIAARECPECGRVYVVAPADDAPEVCARKKHGPKGRQHEDAVTLVSGLARQRHVGVLKRLVEDGPGGVVGVVAEIAAWAKQCAAGLADRHKQELEQLHTDYGATTARDLPAGVKKRLEQRHHRLEREAKQAAYHRFLDEFGAWIRDLLVIHSGGDELVHADHLEDARRDAARLPVEACLRALADINRCRNAITEFNGAPELQIERILHPVAAALFASR